MRLLIVGSDWICKGDLRGTRDSATTVVDLNENTITLAQGDRVFTPVERSDNLRTGGTYWRFDRLANGDVRLNPIKEGEGAYFSKDEIESRKGSEALFFPAMVQGDERYFLEVSPSVPLDDEVDDGQLTYDEDGESGPDSMGPAGTNIIPDDQIIL